MNTAHATRTENLVYGLALLAMALIGVGKLPWSVGAVVAPLAFAVAFGGFWSALHLHAITRLGLLSMALAAHQIPLLLTDKITLYEFLKMFVAALVAYYGGYAASRAMHQRPGRAPRHRIDGLLIAGTCGFVGLVFWSVWQAGFPRSTLFLPGWVMNAVDSSVMHKTHVGMYASLGMALAGLWLFHLPRGASGAALWLLLGALVSAGFMANMALQNRTPVIAMGATLLVSSVIRLRQSARVGWSLKGSALVIFVGIVIVSALSLAFMTWWDTIQANAFSAFDRASMDTPRYRVWREMLLHFFDHPWGGRLIKLPEHYAHNLWLDALYDSGLLAFAGWLSFHVVVALDFWRGRGLSDERTTLLWSGIALSFLCSFLVEPVLAASPLYLWFSLIFCGLIGGRESTRTTS